MVLGDPGRVEALGFGMGDLLGHQAVAFAGRASSSRRLKKPRRFFGVVVGLGQNQCSFCREWRP
jgi:hypothetical protein